MDVPLLLLLTQLFWMTWHPPLVLTVGSLLSAPSILRQPSVKKRYNPPSVNKYTSSSFIDTSIVLPAFLSDRQNRGDLPPKPYYFDKHLTFLDNISFESTIHWIVFVIDCFAKGANMKSYTRKMAILGVAAAFSATAFAGDQTPKPQWKVTNPVQFDYSKLAIADSSGEVKSIVAIKKGVSQEFLNEALKSVQPTAMAGTMCGTMKINSYEIVIFDNPCGGQSLHYYLTTQQLVPQKLERTGAVQEVLYKNTRQEKWTGKWICPPLSANQTCVVTAVETGWGRDKSNTYYADITTPAYYIPVNTRQYRCPTGYNFQLSSTDHDQDDYNAGMIYSCVKT